jgi:hypothetical protein
MTDKPFKPCSAYQRNPLIIETLSNLLSGNWFKKVMLKNGDVPKKIEEINMVALPLSETSELN